VASFFVKNICFSLDYFILFLNLNKKNSKMKGWMYMLRCSNGSYYTGSTNNLDLRLAQHQSGEGANYTKKYAPVELVFFEEFDRIDLAFYREKQIQKWSRAKKEALISGRLGELVRLSKSGLRQAQPPI
jgi:putative endonuclease